MPPERLRIAHVTPHTWGPYNEVNEFVGHAAAELAGRHEVVVAAPSDSRAAIRASRAAIREIRAGGRSGAFTGWRGERAGDAPVLAVGQGIPLPRGPRPRAAPVPLDLSRTVEELLTAVAFDVVHVHDPYAPSASSIALRHSRSLNVGSFHEPTERVLSTQVARPLVEIFFGRLDARTASSAATGQLLERYFPGAYSLVEPGSGGRAATWPGSPETGNRRPARIAFCAVEERGAMRLFLRALRRLGPENEWEATIWLQAGDPPPSRLAKSVRDRIHITGPHELEPAELIAAADVVVLASGGPHTAPSLIREGLAAGTRVVASRTPVYAEALGDGELGALFPAGDAITLAGQLERALGGRTRPARRPGGRTWAEVGSELDVIYRRIAARRHDPAGDAATRRRIARRRTIDIDLHMHTDHSPDCATPVEVLLETAKDRGLGAIAITDHNEVSGAHAAREVAERIGGIKVIVAEEVKTAEQGEVIGLFIEEKIPRGLTMAETIAEIRRQRGLVYVPHPFDRLHSVPDYEHLLDIVEEIDILEVFNPRVALTAFNEEAERFASKYRIVPGAGSDSHVAQGLGSVRIRVHDFEGPQEFLEAMRDADIVRKHKNLVYVQALKFIQTRGKR